MHLEGLGFRLTVSAGTPWTRAECVGVLWAFEASAGQCGAAIALQGCRAARQDLPAPSLCGPLPLKFMGAGHSTAASTSYLGLGWLTQECSDSQYVLSGHCCCSTRASPPPPPHTHTLCCGWARSKSPSPVAIGPRKAALKPLSMLCMGVSCLLSPSCLPHKNLSSSSNSRSGIRTNMTTPSLTDLQAALALAQNKKAVKGVMCRRRR